MKQNIEFKITGIARIKVPKNTEDDTSKRTTTHSPIGAGDKVQIVVSGLDKKRLERLRKYMEAQTGDTPCYYEAVSFAVHTCCNMLDIP